MPHHDTYRTNDASTDLELVENRRANLSTLNHAVNYDTKVRAGCKRWKDRFGVCKRAENIDYPITRSVD